MLKEILKSVAIAVAPPVAVCITLMTIGYIAERADKKRLTKEAERFANDPLNHLR